MRVLAAMTTLVVTLLAIPAWAQDQNALPGDERTTLQQQLDEHERQDQVHKDNAAAVEKAYQSQIKSSGSGPIPKTDPWGNVRDTTSTKNSQSKNSK
jgi:hypothetical protein